MTKKPTQEQLESSIQSLRIHLAEAGALLCRTGQNLFPERRTWLYSVLRELHVVAAFWNIQLTANLSKNSLTSDPEKQEDLFDA